MALIRHDTERAALSPLQAARQDRLDEIAGFRATLGAKAMTAFASGPATKLLIDPESMTFAVTGTMVGRDGKTRDAAIAGRHDARGVATVTHAEEAAKGEAPGAAARRALAQAGRARALDLCREAAGGGSMRIHATYAEFENASGQSPKLDAATAHGRLLALAQAETATACGTKKGRAALEYEVAMQGDRPPAGRRGAVLVVDVDALSRSTHPSALAGVCATLAQVREAEAVRVEALRTQASRAHAAPAMHPAHAAHAAHAAPRPARMREAAGR